MTDQTIPKNLEDLIVSLFSPRSSIAFQNWLKLHDPEFFEKALKVRISEACPLYYVIRFDISSMARRLIEEGADVNAKGGRHPSSLQLACVFGLEKIVKELVRHGADVNAKGGIFGTAL